jgi:uncharacterized protein (UPF0332 family)
MNGHLERADDALASAQLLFDAGRFVGAVDRAYYTVFYAQQAVLAAVTEIKPSQIKTHHGLRQMFELHVVKPGLLDIAVAAAARPLEASRITADYTTEVIPREEAEAAIECARSFLNACIDLIQRHEP